MPAKPSSSETPLPRGWPSCVKTALLQVISLAQFTLAYGLLVQGPLAQEARRGYSCSRRGSDLGAIR
jgi:hypothetical protein